MRAAGRLSLLSLLILTVLGCSAKGEASCKAFISKTLINPETVEFRDYRSLDSDGYLAMLAQSGARKQGIQISEQQRAAGRKVMSEMLEKNPNTLFSTVRVRAEGRLGNKVTSQLLCLNTKGQCSCHDVTV